MHDLFTGPHVVSTPVAVTDLNLVDPLPTESSSQSVLPAVGANVARAIPDSAGTVVGREAELALLATVLLRPGVRVLTLTGPPGIGKTTVAFALARRASEAFNGLVALAVDTPAGLISAMAECLGVLDATGSTTIESISDAIGERATLLVFDNLSATSDEVAQLSVVLERSPGLKLIVTAGAPLELAGEREFAVPALALPAVSDSNSVGAIEREAAVALFVERARAVQPAFTLNVANAVAVAEICRRIQGIPLAIEIAAARSRTYPPQTLLGRLSERIDVVVPPAPNAVNTTAMLTTLIDWSVETLSAADEQLFRSLGVFPGTFDVAAAHAVADPATERLTLERQLKTLVDAALVHRHVNAFGDERYHLPGPVWNRAHAALCESGLESAVRQRHAAWFAGIAAEAAAGLRTDRQHEWLGQLQTEVHNLRAALEWLYASRQTDDALRMATDLSRFWASRSGVSEGRAWLERGIADTNGVAPTTIAAARDAASWLVLLQGDMRAATGLIEQNLALYRSIDDRRGIATTLDGLGELALSGGDVQHAERCFAESIALWTAQAAGWNVAMTRISLGCVALNLDELARASDCFAAARTDLESLGDRRAAGVALLADAWLKLHRGARSDARRDFLIALRTFRDLGVVLETAEALEGLSSVVQADGDDAKARELLSGALLLRRESGIHPSFISRLGYLSERAALRERLNASNGFEAREPTRTDVDQCIALLLGDSTASD